MKKQLLLACALAACASSFLDGKSLAERFTELTRGFTGQAGVEPEKVARERKAEPRKTLAQRRAQRIRRWNLVLDAFKRSGIKEGDEDYKWAQRNLHRAKRSAKKLFRGKRRRSYLAEELAKERRQDTAQTKTGKSSKR